MYNIIIYTNLCVFRKRVNVRNPNNLSEGELQAMAQAMFEEESEDEVGGEPDTSEDEEVMYSEHNSDSEEELSDSQGEAEDLEEENVDFFLGKDKTTKWSKNPIASKFSKTKKKNIVYIFPGLTSHSRDITDERSAFEKILTDNIIENIVECTNKEIEMMRARFSRPRDAKNTTKNEIMAFIGLLLLAGEKSQNHTNFLELWATDGTASEIFRACMGSNRFLFLLNAIRFDDKTTRPERKKTDKLAAIRFTLDCFVENCKRNYTPGTNVTIDEMLIPFRGRCSFVQYIPNKPAKYGIKAFVLCDSKTFYVSNFEIYCGQQPEGPYKVSNKPCDIAHRLMGQWKGKNRNLTCDNWYTSYSLAVDLLKEKTTMVGTIKKNKRELPPEFLPNKSRQVKSSVFGYQNDVTIVSYVPKKNRSVVLISTMHDDGEIDPETNKPTIILDYNSNKGGVDTVDKMCATYSVNRRCRRYPLVIFFQILNISGINSQVLYNAAHVDNPQKFRRVFLKNLSISLMKPFLIERSYMQNLPMDIKNFLRKFSPHPDESDEEPPVKIRKRCFLCGRAKNRVTTITCSSCKKSVCKQHSVAVITCQECKILAETEEHVASEIDD